MYERCREAPERRAGGQKARSGTYETGIHIYSFNGRIFFCIMQSARGSPLASPPEISRIILRVNEKKKKKKERQVTLGAASNMMRKMKK